MYIMGALDANCNSLIKIVSHIRIGKSLLMNRSLWWEPMKIKKNELICQIHNLYKQILLKLITLHSPSILSLPVHPYHFQNLSLLTSNNSVISLIKTLHYHKLNTHNHLVTLILMFLINYTLNNNNQSLDHHNHHFLINHNNNHNLDHSFNRHLLLDHQAFLDLILITVCQKPQCQIWKLLEHTAAKCYYRYRQPINARPRLVTPRRL